MGDRYRTADGWAVEVVELSATPDRNDGERLKVTYCGFFVALVRTVAELERWFLLTDLEPETLIPGHHGIHGPLARADHRRGVCCGRARSGPVDGATDTQGPGRRRLAGGVCRTAHHRRSTRHGWRSR